MQSTVCGGFAGDTQPSVQVELVDPVSASGLASRIETSDTGRRSGFDAVKVRGAGSARGCTRLPLRRGSPAPRLTTFDATARGAARLGKTFTGSHRLQARSFTSRNKD
jgi:hypothetical protein